jgi:hypothetical protein
MRERMAVYLGQGDSEQLELLQCKDEKVRSITVSNFSPPYGRWSIEDPSAEGRQGGAEWFSTSLLNTPTGWSVVESGLTHLDLLPVWLDEA